MGVVAASARDFAHGVVSHADASARTLLDRDPYRSAVAGAGGRSGASANSRLFPRRRCALCQTLGPHVFEFEAWPTTHHRMERRPKLVDAVLRALQRGHPPDDFSRDPYGSLRHCASSLLAAALTRCDAGGLGGFALLCRWDAGGVGASL